MSDGTEGSLCHGMAGLSALGNCIATDIDKVCAGTYCLVPCGRRQAASQGPPVSPLPLPASPLHLTICTLCRAGWSAGD
eukprot:COSAG01_NODE_3997_length_5448_cov_1.814919_7_plen_79_part_00